MPFEKFRYFSSHFFLFELSVLSKLIDNLNESDNKFSGEKELVFLQALLQSKEINALVNVHHKVAKMGKDDRIAPILSASMQVIKCKQNIKIIHAEIIIYYRLLWKFLNFCLQDATFHLYAENCFICYKNHTYR